MLFRPDRTDFRLIGFYTGRVVGGVGLAMLVPTVLAFALGEHSDGFGFLIGASVALIAGSLGTLLLRTRAPLRTTHGLATVALAWLVAPLPAAIPFILSGHYASFLDAYFEAMSGFATIGLTLANDLDHMSVSVNLWRHLTHFLGGQGIVIVVLTIFAAGGGHVGSLYTGEGREEKIVPNVISTARFIWKVALVYGLLGTTLLWVAMLFAGLQPLSALYHAASAFMASFDTGGFAVMSSSAAFYRSPAVELVLIVLMLAGAFSFALHYQLWRGRQSELYRNIETRTMALSILMLFTFALIGLARTGTFEHWSELFRHGFFQIVSGHTSTGLGTVPGRLFLTDWGMLAPAMLVTAMAIGGMAGSTAAGIKAIRVGVVLKGLRADIRRVLLPEHAAVVETFHSTTKRILRAEQVRQASMLLVLFVLMYLLGGLLGLFYGYDMRLALFESTAAGSGAGFSVGVVRPALEWPIK
ncbi:MAG TPA: potassium transporter TrkG, partial [Egibacteraceae bacterium]|nr:potassium transporter TrkG [Egibacteraceae bacterium]